MRPRPESLALFAAALTGIQVGAAMVATRVVVHDMGPGTLAFLRYAVGERARFAWRDLGPIAVLGIFQFGVLIALLNVGLRYTTSARAALLFATFPLMTMVAAALLGREGLTALTLICRHDRLRTMYANSADSA